MRGPSGRRRLGNWSRQGPNFGPRSAPPSTRPIDVNWMKRGIQGDMDIEGVDEYGYGGEAQFSVGGVEIS